NRGAGHRHSSIQECISFPVNRSAERQCPFSRLYPRAEEQDARYRRDSSAQRAGEVPRHALLAPIPGWRAAPERTGTIGSGARESWVIRAAGLAALLPRRRQGDVAALRFQLAVNPGLMIGFFFPSCGSIRRLQLIVNGFELRLEPCC